MTRRTIAVGTLATLVSLLGSLGCSSGDDAGAVLGTGDDLTAVTDGFATDDPSEPTGG